MDGHDFFADYGYDYRLYEDGTWVDIKGRRFKIRGLRSVQADRAVVGLVEGYGDRDFKKDPIPGVEDVEMDFRRLASGVLIDWGDDIPDPADPTESLPFSVENALRLLEAAPGFVQNLRQKAGDLSNFQTEATRKRAGNSSGLSGSKPKTARASGSTKRSNGKQDTAHTS